MTMQKFKTTQSLAIKMLFRPGSSIILTGKDKMLGNESLSPHKKSYLCVINKNAILQNTVFLAKSFVIHQ
jgi:hypothetical protein